MLELFPGQTELCFLCTKKKAVGDVRPDDKEKPSHAGVGTEERLLHSTGVAVLDLLYQV